MEKKVKCYNNYIFGRLRNLRVGDRNGIKYQAVSIIKEDKTKHTVVFEVGEEYLCSFLRHLKVFGIKDKDIL